MQQYPVSKAIAFPPDFLPGTGDNFLSNEYYTDSSTGEELWQFLEDPALWPTYFNKVSKVQFIEQEGTKLKVGSKFTYKDAVLKLDLECECIEFQPPAGSREGRVTWKGVSKNKKGEIKFENVRGWIVENMSYNKTRIFTQEVQRGEDAQKLVKDSYDMLTSIEKWIRCLADKGSKNKNGLLSKII